MLVNGIEEVSFSSVCFNVWNPIDVIIQIL